MILRSELSGENFFSELLGLNAEAIGSKDFTLANQIYISTRDKLVKWLEGPQFHDLEANSLSMVFEIGLEYIKFHRNTTGIVYFEAAGLCDYLSNVSEQSAIIRN